MVYRYRTFKRLEHFFFISLKRKMCQIFFFFWEAKFAQKSTQRCAKNRLSNLELVA